MEANKKYYPRPLWFWNEKPTEESIREVMENCARQDKYAGFGILPYDACKLDYMGEEYLRLYGFVLREAKRLGLKICLYDEWWFPSGWAGGILQGSTRRPARSGWIWRNTPPRGSAFPSLCRRTER